MLDEGSARPKSSQVKTRPARDVTEETTIYEENERIEETSNSTTQHSFGSTRSKK